MKKTQITIKRRSLIYLTLLFNMIIPVHLCSMLEPQPTTTLLKIKDSDEQIIEIRLDIAKESKTITNMLEDLGGIPEYPISIEFSSSIITECFNIMAFLALPELDPAKPKEDPLKTEHSLKTMILIVNCIDHLEPADSNIKKEIREKIYPKIYSLCKRIPFEESASQVKKLYSTLVPEAFGNTIVNRLKLLLIEKSLNQENRRIETSIGYGDTAFSHNNTMIAGANRSESGLIAIESLNDGKVIATHTNQSRDLTGYGSITFINDKKLAILMEKNIFVYDVNNNGAMSEKPSQTLIFDIPYAGHSLGKKQIKSSKNNEFIASSHRINCFLWQIDKNGAIASEPDHLIKNETIISQVTFYDDAIAIITKKEDQSSSHLHVFNTDGTLNFKFELPSTIQHADFYSYDKKFIATFFTNSESEMLIYDFNNRDKIAHQKVYLSDESIKFVGEIKIILDDNAIVMEQGNNLLLVDISNINNDPILPCKKITIQDWNGYFFVNQDSSMIAFGVHRSKNLLYMLFTDQEKAILEKIKNLEPDQLLLIDKMIDGDSDLPKLKASSEIIGLLNYLGLMEPQQKPASITQAAAIKHLGSQESKKPLLDQENTKAGEYSKAKEKEKAALEKDIQEKKAKEQAAWQALQKTQQEKKDALAEYHKKREAAEKAYANAKNKGKGGPGMWQQLVSGAYSLASSLASSASAAMSGIWNGILWLFGRSK